MILEFGLVGIGNDLSIFSLIFLFSCVNGLQKNYALNEINNYLLLI